MKLNRFFLIAMVAFLLLNCASVTAQTPQEHVPGIAHSVMPFDMAKTTHIFKMTEIGGVQRVVMKDKSDSDRVVLFQRHLREEAARFQHGSDLPDGAKITFTTRDPHLLTAIHRWLGAQLSEHGADAKTE